jgi:hypothetical protein
MAESAIWRSRRRAATMSLVEAAFDDRDVTAILSGVFDINRHLTYIADDVYVMRRRLEDGDDEEEEEEDNGGGGPES